MWTMNVIKVHCPVWLKIKYNPSYINGAKHLQQTINLSRYLNTNLKKIIDKVIRRNGYCGDPENLLIFMLRDDRAIIRDVVYQEISKVRTQNNLGLRTFKGSKFNFDPENYTDIISWRDGEITELPLILNILDEALKTINKGALNTCQNIKILPCHSQAAAVAAVKLVTGASSKISRGNKRDYFIRTRLMSRQQIFF